MDSSFDPYDSRMILGVDEAGRGPLAGPVVAAGVVLDRHQSISGLDDSKKLTQKKREQLFLEIQERALVTAICEIDAAQIDSINILQATFLAMKNVVLKIQTKIKFDVVLVDGNKTIPGQFEAPQQAIIKGDSLVPSIMAASILAKVHRDRLMEGFDKKFPGYGFAQHKGYGTKIHMEALDRLGPCAIHRQSFAPVRTMRLL